MMANNSNLMQSHIASKKKTTQEKKKERNREAKEREDKKTEGKKDESNHAIALRRHRAPPKTHYSLSFILSAHKDIIVD